MILRSEGITDEVTDLLPRAVATILGQSPVTGSANEFVPSRVAPAVLIIGVTTRLLRGATGNADRDVHSVLLVSAYITAKRPLRIGERLRYNSSVSYLRDRGDHLLAEVRHRLRPERGVETVATVDLLLRASVPRTSARLSSIGAPSAPRRFVHTAGGEPKTRDLPTLDPDAVALLAAALGDRNPLHTSSSASRAAGFDATIVPGLGLLELSSATLRPRNLGASTLCASFAAPLLAGDSAALTARFADGCYLFDVEASGRALKRGALLVEDQRPPPTPLQPSLGAPAG